MTIHAAGPTTTTPLSLLAPVCAIIPARGGSKGVPAKNLRPIGGRSLIARAIDAVAAVEAIDRIVVSTDDDDIAAAARDAGAEVIVRPPALSGDTCSSESALLHALDDLDARDELPAVTVFVQATSPFIDSEALASAVDRVRHEHAEVAFSVRPSHAFIWRHGSGGPVGVNHVSDRRLRRQDREPEFCETGAFYVMATRGLRAAGHRFFGRLEMIEVGAADALEIDTEDDLRLAEALVDSMNRSAPAVPDSSAPAVPKEGQNHV